MEKNGNMVKILQSKSRGKLRSKKSLAIDPDLPRNNRTQQKSDFQQLRHWDCESLSTKPGQRLLNNISAFQGVYEFFDIDVMR